jgi:(S)-2-hydroxy-acid oxidase
MGRNSPMAQIYNFHENYFEGFISFGADLTIKGIVSAEDAEIAAQHNVDGVWVSNHGGRQLDTCPSSLDALPEIVDVLRPRYPNIAILFDSGVNRGTDIFKALALGADLCFIGRATLWGLTYDGQAGVELALELLENELRLAMGLAGARNLKEINRSHLGYLKPGVGVQPLQSKL